MTTIHQHPSPELYAQLKADSEALGDKNMCTVLAAAVLTGLSYEKCFKAFEAAGRKPGRGSSVSVQKKAFDLLGYDFIEHDLSPIKDRYKGAHRSLKAFTTYHPIRFAYAWRGTPDLYLQGPTHAAAYKDGRVIDWSNDRKTRVTRAHRVVKRDAVAPIKIEVPELVSAPTVTLFHKEGCLLLETRA